MDVDTATSFIFYLSSVILALSLSTRVIYEVINFFKQLGHT